MEPDCNSNLFIINNNKMKNAHDEDKLIKHADDKHMARFFFK